MSLKELIITLPQYLLPHHFLSKLMSYLTHCRHTGFKNWMIKQVIKIYGVNMAEAKTQDLAAYASFNAFFTRELKAGVRPVNELQDGVVSPADGVVSQIGQITAGEIFQAKGKTFTAIDLLGGDAEWAEKFQNGLFNTIYLSPKDYHRLHMPVSGKLLEMIHIPGRLFSVNAATANSVPVLFARNERVVCLFATSHGTMALILVGAIFVSSIETVWHGVVTPPTTTEIQRWKYSVSDAPVLEKGAEMGRFNMGSTIIVLFEEDCATWNPECVAGTKVQVGELIAQLQNDN